MATARRQRKPRTITRESQQWLRRLARVHAYLSHVVTHFGTRLPNRRDEFSQRMEAGDRTLLLDVAAHGIAELQAVASQIDAAMRNTPATGAEPGSPEKIEVLRQRFANEMHLWIEGDLERR